MAAGVVHGQHLKKKQVPAVAKGAFKAKFPHTKAKWNLENKLFEAHFKKDKAMNHAAFDSTGKWQYTEVEIKKEQVPQPVVEILQKAEYGNWDVTEIDKVVAVNYEELYRYKFVKGNKQISILLLPSGNALKKVQSDIPGKKKKSRK